MNIRAIFATTLATVQGGCSCWLYTTPDDVEMVLDADVLVQDTAYWNQWGTDGDEEALCQAICLAASLRTAEDVYMGQVSSCALELNELGEAYVSGELEPMLDTGLPEFVLGNVQCEGTAAFPYSCEGRRPMGHRAQTARGSASLVDSLADAAVMEEASIRAFAQLALVLRAQGAPAGLQRRCLDAACDEVHHARATRALVGALGGELRSPEADPPGAFDLLTVARHNAVEGCVHETWAALEAHLSSGRAQTKALRGLYARLATDETRHAQLARDLHDWFMERLSEPERAAVEGAMREALSSLPARVALRAARRPPALGGPDPRLAAQLASALAAGLQP